MNSGASETSPIRAGEPGPVVVGHLAVRMWCSGTRASAESSRMVISLRLISSEKIARRHACLIAADRAMSSPSVELWVGIIAAAGEVELVGVVDLHAAHRHAGDPAHVDDEAATARRWTRRRRSLCSQLLALATPEDVVVGAERASAPVDGPPSTAPGVACGRRTR